MSTKHLPSALILLLAGALVCSEVVWPGGGYRLWIGLGIVIAWVVVRNSHVFSTT